MPDKPNRTIVILAVALVVLLLLLVGGGAWVLSRDGTQPVTGVVVTATESVRATAEPAVSVQATAPAAVTSSKPETPPVAEPPAAKPAATSEDGVHDTFIKELIKVGGARLVLDYAQLFTGKEAWDEAAKRGKTAENDFFVVNDNKKLRTFPVAGKLKIVLHPAEGPNYSRNFTIAEFDGLLESGGTRVYGGRHYYANAADVLYKVTIESGKVVRVENVWTP